MRSAYIKRLLITVKKREGGYKQRDDRCTTLNRKHTHTHIIR